jgi:hypothetical protein
MQILPDLLAFTVTDVHHLLFQPLEIRHIPVNDHAAHLSAVGTPIDGPPGADVDDMTAFGQPSGLHAGKRLPEVMVFSPLRVSSQFSLGTKWSSFRPMHSSLVQPNTSVKAGFR